MYKRQIHEFAHGSMVMKVSKLIESLSKYDRDDDVTFYYLKNDTLTNCQLEDIGFYLDMGVEFTIQDTSEVNGSS